MPSLLPAPFLFRFSFPLRHVADVPRKGARLLDLPDECELPRVSELDGEFENPATLKGAWNEEGLGFALRVRGRTKPLQGAATNPTAADGLQVWIDTRNTQSVHRATRFGHHFCLLTGAGGKDPVGLQLPIARAREESPLCTPDDLQVKVATVKDGYDLEAWIPARVLNGFDPDGSPRLGFYYRVRDSELGDQYLSVSPEFPFASDPSTWSTLELVK